MDIRQLSTRTIYNGLRLGATFSLPLIVLGVSFSSIVRADPGEPVIAKPPQACQAQFVIDRRDQPQLALQKLRRCGAIYDASATLEEFTFWYVTLPAKSAPEQKSLFANVWRNKLRALISPPISLSKEEAIRVLDDGVIRALNRGQREELGPQWTATHNPAIFTPSGSAEAHDQTHDAHLTREPRPREGQLPAAKVSASYSVPQLHWDHLSRPTYSEERSDYRASADELNRNQAANNT